MNPCQLKQTRRKQMHMFAKRSGLLSASCTSLCCLTEIERETLPEFLVANMLISVSTIDNTHPPTWQWVTMRSKVVASPLTESCVFVVVCSTYVYFCVYACWCLLACSVCASVSVSITVSGWAGNGRMKLWQRPVTPTPLPLCAAVSSCLINVLRFLSHDGLGQYSVIHFVPGQVCTQGSEWACAVLTWFPLCDWGALWVPASVICSVITLDTCLWVIGRIFALLEKWYLSSEIWYGILIRLCNDNVCETLNATWKLSLLYLTYICFS